MTRTLAAAWTLHRITRSVPLAICAFIIVAALCIGIESERRMVQAEAEAHSRMARSAPTLPVSEQETALVSWRQQLQREASRLPPRKSAASLVRAATGILEESGVAIESVNTSQAAFSATPYAALTLEAHISGSAARAAGALAKILADSPGWSLERLSIERRAEGLASIEMVLVLVHGGAT